MGKVQRPDLRSRTFEFVGWVGPRITRAGNEGLTDHSPRDLYGTVAPLQTALEDAGKDKKGLSGGFRGRSPLSLSILDNTRCV